MTIPVSYTLYINIALVVCLVLALIIGYVKGFMLQLVQALGFVVALAAAYFLSGPFSKAIHLWPQELTPFTDTVLSSYIYDKINVVCWFVVIFLVTLVLMLLLRPLAKMLGEVPVMKQLNQALGMILSALVYVAIVMVAIFIIGTPIFTNGAEIIENSWLKPVKEGVTTVFKSLEEPLMQNEKLQELFQKTDELDNDDFSFLTQWLQNDGVENNLINQFLEQLKK